MSKFQIIFVHTQYDNSKFLYNFKYKFSGPDLQLSVGKLQPTAPNSFKPRCSRLPNITLSVITDNNNHTE